MRLLDRGQTILAMKNKGLLNNIKTASKGETILSGLKKTAAFGSKFPIETCREKIARKYGENALALSGPCEGSNLADCVCKKLSTAGVYSNDIAIKVASVWANEDQMVQCVEDFVRSKKFSMKQACFVCDQLKTKYAEFDDSLADELGGNESSPMGGATEVSVESPSSNEGAGDDFGNTDPFSAHDTEENASPVSGGGLGDGLGGDMNGGLGLQSITVELPLDVIEQFDAAIDKAKGENPANEAHHQVPLNGEAVVELPGQVAESIDQVADQALNTAVDVTKDLGGALESVDKAVEEAPGVTDTNPVGPSDEVAEPGESEVTFESEVSETPGAETPGAEAPSSETSEEVSHNENGESSEGEENNSETTEESPEQFSNEESEETRMAESVTKNFKKGKIASTGEINLDLSEVINVLARQGKAVKTAKEVSVNRVQDDSDIGTISNGKTMGNEQKFDAKGPDVFSGDATMGGEKEADLTPVTNKPEFDSGGAEMGDEKAQGYTAEKQNQATGGEKGQGNHSASSKARVSNLADRILAANAKNMSKTSSDKKLENAKPVSEDKDIQPIQSNKDNPKSGNPITPKDSADIGKTEAGDSSFMGSEKETLTNVPKAENSAPSIPAGGGKNSKYDTNNDAEKQTAQKGTVIAGGDAESLVARKEAATRVAGRKLKAGMIDVSGLAAEIDKLARYESSDLKHLETALFGASKKGLDTVARGSEKPLIISEKSNQRKIASELKDSLQSLFTLDKRNVQAQEDPTVELRRLNYKS